MKGAEKPHLPIIEFVESGRDRRKKFTLSAQLPAESRKSGPRTSLDSHVFGNVYHVLHKVESTSTC